MAVSKFEFLLNVCDEQATPLRTVKLEFASVPDDHAKQQPKVTITDRDTGFSANIHLPKADYTNLQEAFESIQKHCDVSTIQKVALSVLAIFSSNR